MEQLYKTVKFRQFDANAPVEILEEDLTLEEAQERCKGDDSKGDGWFIGYGLM